MVVSAHYKVVLYDKISNVHPLLTTNKVFFRVEKASKDGIFVVVECTFSEGMTDLLNEFLGIFLLTDRHLCILKFCRMVW